MIEIFGKLVNELYLYPTKTIKKLKVMTYADFIWPLILGGVILAIAIELRNINAGVYIGSTLLEGVLLLIGGLIITIVIFLLSMYVLPLLLYKFEFMIFDISNNFRRFAYVVALLAPLYGISVLVRVLLDILLPEHGVFKYIETLVPAVAGLYAMAVLFVALRDFFKVDNVKAVVLTALPWLLIFIYSLV